MSGEHDLSFHAMGSEIRLLIGNPLVASARPASDAVVRERAYIEDFGARLSRFRPDSELCALNADPRASVPASRLLRAAVSAAAWAAERSGGLIDPTLVGALERRAMSTRATARSPRPWRRCSPSRARADPRRPIRRDAGARSSLTRLPA